VKDLLAFVIAGTTVGALYGLTATGLVLTYRTSGILNLAHGSVALIAVDVYIYLTVNRGWTWAVAAGVSVLVAGPAMGLAFERLGRVVVGAAPAVRVAATVGVQVAVGGGAILIGRHLAGSSPHFTRPPLPGRSIEIGGVFVGQDQMILMAVSATAVIGLSAFLRLSRVGVAVRAVVDDPDLLDASGRDPATVRRLAWAVGCTFAALSGVLLALAPTFGANPGAIGRLVLPAFGAAALGGFASLLGAFAGGVGIGVVASILTRYLTTEWLRALPSTLPVVVLFGALLLTPRKRLLERRLTAPLRVWRPSGSGPFWWLGLVVGSALLLLVPSRTGVEVGIYTTWLVFAVLFLSLGLLVRTAGMASLCHLGLAAVGASTFAHFGTGWGLPWGLALVGAAAVTAAIGVVVAVAAVRLSGVFVALATLAFGSLLQQFFYTSPLMFGREIALPAPRPSITGSDESFYYLVLAVLAGVTVLVVAVDRSRLGRLLRGVAEAPLALESQGATVTVTKLVAFAISGALAGVAGGLLASVQNVASATPFGPAGSLTLVAILFVVPFGEPWGALAAGAVYYLLPVKLDVATPGAWTSFVFGTVAVVVVAMSATRIDRRAIRSRWNRTSARGDLATRRRSVPIAGSGVVRPAAGGARHVGSDRDGSGRDGSGDRSGLVLDGVVVHYGGLVALAGVDIAVPPGRITGLIGPNGAGKTTLFDVSSGLVRPSAGTVRLDGRDLPRRLGLAGRARLGLARTFQQPQLIRSATVGDLLALGREAGLAGRHPGAHLIGSRADRAVIDRAVVAAAELTGIELLLGQPVQALSTGERRMVELARCLVADSRVVLLDEPSAGLDRSESAIVASVIRDLVTRRGTGVLLVEHDMSVVMDLCDYIYVLDFGQVIFEGSPAAVQSSSVVRDAYLGGSPAPPDVTVA
jgi:ABC-type branched-subunit amino acid transport system ATPase component/ABC-type branched-subunit amino acid transport system permease subunit